MTTEEKLRYVYRVLCQISVSGDNVERMAAAKSWLKEILNEVKSDGRQQNSGSSGT